MPRYSLVSLTLATLSLVAAATLAQTPDPAGQSTNTYAQSGMQPNAAPIERAEPGARDDAPMPPPPPRQTTLAAGQLLQTGRQVQSMMPVQGVYLRVAPQSAVRAISLTPQRTEIKLEHGVLNLSVRHAEDGSLILIDLPGGQVQPLKSGFYTFNAESQTTRTLKGESEIVPAVAGAKAVKVKEEQAFIFGAAAAGSKPKAHDFAPFMARNDVIPNPATYARNSDGGGYGYGYDPGAAFYGDGYYAPYWAYGYPGWGWDGPYGYGFGLGFGYYGGFGYGGRFGGFRR